MPPISETVGNGLCAVPHPKGRNCSRKKPDTSPHYVIPTAAPAEWRNPPRRIMNHHKIKLATWEDSSTPFHCARNDNEGTFLRIRLPFLECLTPPRCLISLGLWPSQLPRRGSSCSVLSDIWFFGNASVLTGAERHTGRSLHTLTDGYNGTTPVAPITVNCQLVSA